MSLTTSLPSNSHFISIPSAAAMAERYRDNRETILDSTYRNQEILALSETFNRAAFDELLSKEACQGLRIYYGMDEELKVHALIVAVNTDNEDILPEENSLTETEDDVVEEAQRCPTLCPPSSPLNS